MKKVYAATFTQTNAEVLVEVPDLNILTQGKDLVDAIEMARDAIGLSIVTRQDLGDNIPDSTPKSGIDALKGAFAKEGNSIISLVDVDLYEYRRKHDNRTVRRNVTLPNWLNLEAERAKINVSRVLQEALMLKLGITK